MELEIEVGKLMEAVESLKIEIEKLTEDIKDLAESRQYMRDNHNIFEEFVRKEFDEIKGQIAEINFKEANEEELEEELIEDIHEELKEKKTDDVITLIEEKPKVEITKRNRIGGLI